MIAAARSRGFAHEHRRPETVEWYTPAEKLVEPLGGWTSFDLDPCAPLSATPWLPGIHFHSRTARWSYSVADDGLAMTWWGRIFMNPPYTDGLVGPWLEKLARHGRGTALIFNRTDTAAYQRHVLGRASGRLEVAGRVAFLRPDGTPAGKGAGAPLVLVAYGEEDLERLAAAAEAPVYRGRGAVAWSAGRIPGTFTVLRTRAFVAIIFPPSNEEEKINTTWADVVARAVEGRTEPFTVADVYRRAAGHPKAAGNRHVRDKVRQQLQSGRYERLSPGVYRPAP